MNGEIIFVRFVRARLFSYSGRKGIIKDVIAVRQQYLSGIKE